VYFYTTRSSLTLLTLSKENMMKIKNLFLMALILSLSFVFIGCDDDDNNDNNSTGCGDLVKNGDEECDGADIGEITCNELFAGTTGTITCDDSCMLVTDSCEAAECGDDIMNGNEECDGADFGTTSCEQQGAYSGGDLTCTADCTIDLGECIAECAHEDFFDDCLTNTANQCCDMNGMPSACTDFWGGLEQGHGFCLQTCSDGDDCGWTLGCVAQNHCFYNFCGGGSDGAGEINTECTVASGRTGWCYPLWRSMDDTGICFENGTATGTDTCVRDDDNSIEGLTGVDKATQCENGMCIPAEGETEGTCVAYCDPVASFEGNDTCPTGWNCLNYSSIDTDETNTDGSVNDNYLFREADYGICYPMTDGVHGALDSGLLTCNIITGKTIVDDADCPTDQACKYIMLGSLTGFCADIQATPLTEGEVCEFPATEEDAYECAAGLNCFIADPFNDVNQADPALACARMCDGLTYDATPNSNGCEGLEVPATVDASAIPYVCLTASRFFTADHELPFTGTGLDKEVEASPSRLGFCVAPPVAAK
jgi:hypothetical protein